MKFYESIDTLSIYRFNKINETGQLFYLIKGNTPDEIVRDEHKMLPDIWGFICDEYSKAIESLRQRNTHLDTLKHIARLRIDKYIIKNTVLEYTMKPSKEVIRQLAVFGFYVDPMNSKTYAGRCIESAEINRRLATFDAKIKVLSRDLPDEKNDNKEIITFDELVLVAEKHIGRRIDKMTTYVREWIAIENELLKSNKHGKDQE